MSAHCHHCHDHGSPSQDPRYRRVLWIALLLNAAMFAVEIGAGLQSGSVSLLADAVDFAGDAANYGLSLAVLGMGVAMRARAALVKALSMGAFGVAVLLRAAWSVVQGTTPEPLTMGTVAVLALAVNVGVAVLLYAWREGDANMRSVWLCTRNDAIGNLAVGAAALGVFGTGSAWPDLAVATVMAALALMASVEVARQARRELSEVDAAHHLLQRDRLG
jgi:Co/Zn/Cd efflux system component